MRLKHLELESFRNLKNQTVDFPNRVSVIIGKNGQGKTSLLESVYTLSHTKSFRSYKPKELINWNDEKNSSMSVTGEVEGESGEKRLGLAIDSGKKRLSVNSNPVTTIKDYYGLLRSVEFTPEDIGLVSSGPG